MERLVTKRRSFPVPRTIPSHAPNHQTLRLDRRALGPAVPSCARGWRFLAEVAMTFAAVTGERPSVPGLVPYQGPRHYHYYQQEARPRMRSQTRPRHGRSAIRRLCWRRSEEHTSELQSHVNLVCRLLLEKKKKTNDTSISNKKKNTNTRTNSE